jgi:hypothetical protein
VPSSWSQPLQLPLAPGGANIGLRLVLDHAGNPTVGVLNDLKSATLRCPGDCANPATGWERADGVGTSDLNSALPPLKPASCLSASWGMYVGPDVALDAFDKPIVVFTARAVGLGGQCGTGSLAITTDSFMSARPP